MKTLKYFLVLGVGVLFIIGGLLVGAILGAILGLDERTGALLVGGPLFWLVFYLLKRYED